MTSAPLENEGQPSAGGVVSTVGLLRHLARRIAQGRLTLLTVQAVLEAKGELHAVEIAARIERLRRLVEGLGGSGLT